MKSAHAGKVIDLNADVGEGGTQDEALFTAGMSSANVSCGGHAGDASTLARACALAARHGVALGAHPGFADPEFFGRRERPLDRPGLEALLSEQWARLAGHARVVGLPIRHLKPHGALYHQLNRDLDAARWLIEIISGLVPEAAAARVALWGPPEGALNEAARAAGWRFVPEGFVDRGYRADGSLVSRGEPGAVLHDEADVVAQALRLAEGGRVRTLCVHGDGAHATRLLATVRAALVATGFTIAAPPALGEVGGGVPS